MNQFSNIPLNVWFPVYMKALFIFSQTYKSTFTKPDEDGFYADEDKLNLSFKCFIISLFNILPDQYMKDKMLSFIYMDQTVSNLLLSEDRLKSFFNSYPSIKKEMQTYSNSDTHFLDYCIKDEFTMFMWVYLLQSYIFILMNKVGNNIQIKSLNETKSIYNTDSMSKDDWGNVIWFILHTASLYSVAPMEELFYNFKAMLSCLQYLLPCPKCRAHLRQNLTKIYIDYCKESKLKLFECSWKLHNIVNESLNKYQPTLQEALNYYIYR